MRETDRKQVTSGTWVVIGLVVLGIAAALVGLKFRQLRPDPFVPNTRPASGPAKLG
jgi:hypothetical protein